MLTFACSCRFAHLIVGGRQEQRQYERWLLVRWDPQLGVPAALWLQHLRLSEAALDLHDERTQN